MIGYGRTYVQALEGPSRDPAVGVVPHATVPKLWHARSRGEDNTATTDVQVQLGN